MRERRALVALLLGFGLLAGCGGGDGGEAEPREAATGTLDGTYALGGNILRLDRGRWTVIKASRETSGQFSLSQDLIVLRGLEACAGDGTYSWEQEQQNLTLEAVDEPCSDRRVLLNEGLPWTRLPTLADGPVEEEPMVLSDGLSLAVYAGQTDATGRRSLRLETGGVEGVGPFFAPTVVKGSPGQVLELNLVNRDDMRRHNLTIEELAIDQDLEAGGRATIEVTLPESGTLPFFCRLHDVEGHRGEFLIVEG